MNALQEGEALHEQADPVVDGEPGFVGRGMAVTAPPPPDCLLEGWREATFAAAASIGSRIGRHGRILIPGRCQPSNRGPTGIAIIPEMEAFAAPAGARAGGGAEPGWTPGRPDGGRDEW